MRRRDLITLIGAGVVWPLALRAQQRAPVIGVLNSGSPEASANLMQSLRKGLSETGYFEGQNLIVDYRWSFGRYNSMKPGGHEARLPAKAATLSPHNEFPRVVPAKPASMSGKGHCILQSPDGENREGAR